MWPVQPKDVMAVSDQLGLDLSDLEAKVYAEALDGLIKSMEDLPNMADDRPPVRQTVRDAGRRPTAKEDPLNCIITKCFVKGADSGPLKGKRIGLKDHISLAGVPMTLSSRFMEGYFPEIDATLVTRILDAGGDIVAKCNMDPFSHGTHGFGTGIGDYGRPLNPHNPEHFTGGSSSGCGVAVGANAVDMAVGGDQGGSIRIPASWCGIVGLKPTHALVPHTGVIGVDPCIDFVGPMTKTVEDAALLLEVMAGQDVYDSRQLGMPPIPSYTDGLDKGIAGMRVGILKEGFGDPDAEADVEGAVREAAYSLRKLGAKVEEVSIPAHKTAYKLMVPFLMLANGFALRHAGSINVTGYYDTHFMAAFTAYVKGRPEMIPQRIKQWLLLGGVMGDKALLYYGKAHNVRRLLQREYEAAFNDVDMVVFPTCPVKAPKYTPPKDYEEALQRTLIRKHIRSVATNTAPLDVTGHPALTVPCAMSNGLPIGLCFVGPLFSDDRLLRAAYAYEHSVDWDKFMIASPYGE